MDASDGIIMGLYTDGSENANTDPLNDRDAMELFGFPLIENTSHQHPSSLLLQGGACYYADDKPLWWLTLRWMKMMLLKVARSYHAKPYLLALAPLLVGAGLGYWIAKWHFHSQLATRSGPKKVKDSTKQQNGQAIHVVRIGMPTRFLSAVWCRLSTGVATLSFTAFANASSTIKNSRDFVDHGLAAREIQTREHLNSDKGVQRQSGVPFERVPRHLAVIMDGNRRYGKTKYGSAAKGHWDGSSKLVEFAKWCMAEEIGVLTVFAFSSENWKRDPAEIAALMQIFTKYCDELRVEAIERNIKINVLSTDYEKVSIK